MSKDNLGDRIRTARTSAGLTQLQLGQQIYTSQQTISRIETDRADPSFNLVKAIAKSTNQNINFFE